MISLIFSFAAIVAILFAGYRIAVAVVKRWTGCTSEEAERRVNRMANSMFEKPIPSIQDDQSLCNDMWNNVKAVIGEGRYRQLVEMANNGECFYYFTDACGISCLEMAMFVTDENERKRIGTLCKHTMQQHLVVRGYSDIVDSEWYERDDLAMDVLRIYYAPTDAENDRLINRLHLKSRILAKRNKSIEEDDDDEDNKYVK